MNESNFDKYLNLGKNIAYYRRVADYSQMEFAELLGINRTHMGNIELARAGVSLDVLFKASEVLKVPIQKFFDVRD